jgi:hypothetical protein
MEKYNKIKGFQGAATKKGRILGILPRSRNDATQSASAAGETGTPKSSDFIQMRLPGPIPIPQNHDLQIRPGCPMMPHLSCRQGLKRLY